MKKNKHLINVCLTSDQLYKYEIENSIVVVIDILRATSVISTAFHFGIKSVKPVSTIEEAISYKQNKDYICAGERNALPIEELEYGNSPYQYMNNEIKDKKLIITTTNGTNAIKISKNAKKVIIASYININACSDFLINQNHNIIFLCSGWKGFYNLEDSIFAGEISELVLKSNKFTHNCDSLRSCIYLNNLCGNDNFTFLKNSSHRKRLKNNNMEKDTIFCLKPTFKSEIVPMLLEDTLYNLEDINKV